MRKNRAAERIDPVPPEQYENDPQDHSRTFRRHAGEGIDDHKNFPGYVLVMIGFGALAIAITAAGYGYEGWTLIGGIVAAVCLVGGAAWVVLEHRRVKHQEGKSLLDQEGH